MATDNAAQLLITIAADPSQAENSIQQFSANCSSNLDGLSSDISQWSSQSARDFQGMQQSVKGLSTNFGASFGTLSALFNQNQQSAARWQSTLSQAFQGATTTSSALQASLLGGFQLFDAALSRNIGNAKLWQTSIGEAFTKAAVRSISAVAEEAIVRALFSTALGFYLTAIGDFSGAAQAFESAAVFGAVGGAAGLATVALASGGSSGSAGQTSSSNSNSSRSSSTSKSATSKTAPSNQPSVQIVFQGPIYGGQAGIDQLTREISRAVQERDVNLVAYTSVRQTATRA